MSFLFILPVMVTIVGLYLLFKLKFFFILHPVRTVKEFLVEKKNKESISSLYLALAGTLGVGNIFGVAAGLMIGGEGSLFWLFLSSFFSAVIKYAEVVLTFDIHKGLGMAGIISRTFRCGNRISKLYAGLTVGLSLVMGGMMQSVAVYDVARQSAGFLPPISAVLLVILIIPALVGGVRKIEKITEKVIPLTTIIYILMCLCAILTNFKELPGTIMRVVCSAFSTKSIAGGTLALAIKEGFSRGILSNEAGAGTSALAHSRAKGRSPHVAGLFGMCEVFFDTTILCSLTGISILVSVDNISDYATPMELVCAAFRLSVGKFADLLLPLIFSFGYATIICWFYYGFEYSLFYFPKKSKCFLPIFLLCVSFSYLVSQSFMIYLTDIVLLLMTMLTLSCIVKRLDRIVLLSGQIKNPEI